MRKTITEDDHKVGRKLLDLHDVIYINYHEVTIL